METCTKLLSSVLLNVVFPPKCICCRKPVKNSRYMLCHECSGSIGRTIGGGKMYGEHFYECIASLYYENMVRDALIRYKFDNCRYYSSTFASILEATITEQYKHDFDIVSWVPLSKERLKKRGYDQSFLIAKHIAESLNKPCIKVVKKIKDTKAQSQSGNAENRRLNIYGAYSVESDELFRGKKILLIDDIVTTGSTFSECAKVLMQAGAARVLCAAVARSKDDKGEI